MDPDQNAPIHSDLDLHCLLKRLQNVSVDKKNIRLFVICALRIIHVRSVIYGQDFHEMHARLRGPKSLLTIYQIINKS